MGNIKTCVDSSRETSVVDDNVLEERFRLMEDAMKRSFDPVTGEFRPVKDVLKELEQEETEKLTVGGKR